MPTVKLRNAGVFDLDAYRAKCRAKSPPKYLRPPQTADPFLSEAALMGRAIRVLLRCPNVDTWDLRILLGKMRTSLDLHISVADDPVVRELEEQWEALQRGIAGR